MSNTNQSKSFFETMKVNPKIYWIGITALALIATCLGIWSPNSFAANPFNQAIREEQTSRASGFTMKAEAKIVKNAKTGKPQVFARMFATGPMHNDEVIRMEGSFSLILPNGKVILAGPSSWTFGENLKAAWPIENIPTGSKVKISGTIHVYHREDVKSEREMMADGAVRLYMNTGTVSFRKIPKSVPPQLEVECLDLESVHQHGLELIAPDKKTVSNRILLIPGKQNIERETLPFVGKKVGMEPYLIHQLIPKRKEPVTLVVPVQSSP
ncbi:MAG: hypothetical protein WCG75_09980 [Armatimonadota bacterium]